MKKILSLAVVLILFFIASHAKAQILSPDADANLHNQAEAMSVAAGFNESTSADSVPNTIATIIKTFLGLLGIIFIVLVIWSGYEWMTAGGNEEIVTKSKARLTRAVIGLIIIVSAYSVTYFVFGALDGTMNGL